MMLNISRTVARLATATVMLVSTGVIAAGVMAADDKAALEA